MEYYFYFPELEKEKKKKESTQCAWMDLNNTTHKNVTEKQRSLLLDTFSFIINLPLPLQSAFIKAGLETRFKHAFKLIIASNF